ncbi:MAG TPA: aldo/keto reductase, partial [Bacteroidales bacterium]|nr:aldo/keto reductase [Bacteroidales bacterium]
ILHAFDQGITHFDLANNYGPPPGSAEESFGRILNKELKNYRDEIIISTKAGYYMWPGPYGEWGSKKYLISSLDQSLKRLGLDYVDIFYSHRPDPDTPFEETMGALDQIVKSGKALYAGLSNYTAEQTKEAIEILQSLGTKCLIHQPRYNMFDRWVEDGLLDVLEKYGVGCIPFSPLAQGLLTDKYIDGIPEGSRMAGESVFLRTNARTDETVQKISNLNKIASSRNQSLAQMALSWLLKKPGITSVLIGASRNEQLDDSINATDNMSFTDEELNEIELILQD